MGCEGQQQQLLLLLLWLICQTQNACRHNQTAPSAKPRPLLPLLLL